MTETDTTTTAPKRRGGRPRKGEPPRIPYEELDKLIVHGEIITCEDGESSTVVYPTYRDLAKRYGCAHSLVSAYAKRHNCLRRREEAKLRVAAQADAKLVEMRAGALAVSRDDALKIIDGYIRGFEQSLAAGSVSCNNPSDFNTILRLRSFVEGGADSRAEVRTSISLEGLQERHIQQLRAARGTTPEERGEVRALTPADIDGYQGDDSEGEESHTPDYIDHEGDDSVQNTD